MRDIEVDVWSGLFLIGSGISIEIAGFPAWLIWMGVFILLWSGWSVFKN